MTWGRRCLEEVKRAVKAAPIPVSRRFRMKPEGGSGRNGKSWMQYAEDREKWAEFCQCVP